jgi:hypothetical protein
MDRHIKNKGIHSQLVKRGYDQHWANHDEEEKEYVWQESQWCPRGLSRSQKGRVQRLRNKELEA